MFHMVAAVFLFNNLNVKILLIIIKIDAYLCRPQVVNPKMKHHILTHKRIYAVAIYTHGTIILNHIDIFTIPRIIRVHLMSVIFLNWNQIFY